MPSGFRSSKGAAAFTLVELLTASAVLVVILLLTLVMISHLTRLTSEGTASIRSFQEARTAFETVQRTLSQAVLNSYWDYDNPAAPGHYLRASELHFVLGSAATLTGLADTAGSAVFCQAPLGSSALAKLKSQGNLLNALGFYVRFSPSSDLPAFLNSQEAATRAWRLWMYLEPTESLSVYTEYSGHPQAASDLSWFQPSLALPERNHVLANHVVLFLIRAGYTDANGRWTESYLYDSRGASPTTAYPQAPEIHQVPPVLHVTLAAIDSRTADRLLAASGGAAYHLVPPGLFTDAARYADDLGEFTKHLDSRPIGGMPIQYRVFETTINVTSSKWSR